MILTKYNKSQYNNLFNPIKKYTSPLYEYNRNINTNIKKHKILTFNGDGIGTECVTSARRVIDAIPDVNIEWIEMPFGYDELKRGGKYLTEDHLLAFEEIGVLFKGPLTIPPKDENTYINARGRNFTSGNQVFRKLFQLYANVRPLKSFKGVKSRYDNINMVVIRENTEDVYTGEEEWVNDDTVECIKRISKSASRRIAKYGFDIAERDGFNHITCVHKANVCKQSDGLFLSEFYKEANLRHNNNDNDNIIIDDALCDSLLTSLVQRPEEYGVLVCPNLYGDLISDLGGGLIGSLGLCGSGNIGSKQALFEPAHGSAPDIAGKNIVNPISQMLSGVMMLNHIGEHEAAKILQSALETSLVNGVSTKDIGGKCTTKEYTDYIINEVKG